MGNSLSAYHDSLLDLSYYKHIHSFVRSFVRLFRFVHSFVRSFVRLFVHPFIYLVNKLSDFQQKTTVL